MPINKRAVFDLGFAMGMCSPVRAVDNPNLNTLGALDAWVSVCNKAAPVG